MAAAVVLVQVRDREHHPDRAPCERARVEAIGTDAVGNDVDECGGKAFRLELAGCRP